MSRKFKFFILTISAVLFLSLPDLKATHIVGGEMTYRCLGNGYFEISLTFTRDCELGADDAQFDDYAILALYDQYYNPVSLGANGMFLLPFHGDYTVNTSLENDCEIVGYEVCVHQTVYRDTIYLLPKKGGYIFSYKRCCRNSTLLNIVDPLQTGSTQTIRITEEAFNECNSSPVFNSWPDIYVCTNKSIDFDHSATDVDGDSLAYKLFTPYKGASIQNPKPDRFAEFDVPLEELNWAPGYSEDNMLGGTPLSIDAETGFITGIPNQEGQFLVGVMVEEYRNGKLLSVVRRDFEYNVRVCLDPPLADFEVPNVLCGESEFTVNFNNTSQNADSYYWQFNYPSQLASETSVEENPVYTYPNTADFDGKDSFLVRLKAFRSFDLCYDELTKQILVIQDEVVVDFDANVEDCPGDSLDIHLKDLSVGLNPSYTINTWNWTVTLNDGTVLTGNGKDEYFTIIRQKQITVLLEIFTEEGCSAFLEKTIDFDYVELEFIANPVVYCVGDSSRLVANPNSDWTYTWQPETGLYFADPNDRSNPMCSIDNDTIYYVTVTDGICTLVDSVQVLVQDYLDISIKGPDFVCEDTITLVALGGNAGITVFEWAENADFNPVLMEGDTVTFYIDGLLKKYFLRVKEGTGCSVDIDSLEAFNNSVDLDYNKNEKYCYGLEKDIVVNNLRVGDTLIFNWEPSPYIISALDSNVVTVFTDNQGGFELIFHVVNQFGCTFSDTIFVENKKGPDNKYITESFECGTFKMCFSAFNGEGENYNWDFGDPNTTDDVSSEVNPCYDYPGPGTYTVSITADFEDCGTSLTLTKDVIVPDLFELIGKDTLVYCEGEDLMLSVNPSNFSMDVTWFDEGGNQIGTGIMIMYTPTGDEHILVVGVDTFGCADSLDMFLDMFEFDLSKDNPSTLCQGDTVTLHVYNNSTDSLKYNWEPKDNIISPLDADSIIVVLESDDDYVVTVTGVYNGCSTVVTIGVLVSNINIDIDADTTKIVITKSTELTVVGNFDEFAKILWSTGETSETISISPTESTTYCVTVTDEFGCFDVQCVDIEVIDPACNETDIYIPNVFSPNNDGHNDNFRPRGLYIEQVEIYIYDRWGEEILYKKGGPNTSWDGSYKGGYLGPDSYAYIIRVVCQDTDEYQAQGNITIIK